MAGLLLAHAVLFKLYLPSRYIARTLRVVIVDCGWRLTLMVLLETILRWAMPISLRNQAKSLHCFIDYYALLIALTLLIGYPLQSEAIVSQILLTTLHGTSSRTI